MTNNGGNLTSHTCPGNTVQCGLPNGIFTNLPLRQLHRPALHLTLLHIFILVMVLHVKTKIGVRCSGCISMVRDIPLVQWISLIRTDKIATTSDYDRVQIMIKNLHANNTGSRRRPRLWKEVQHIVCCHPHWAELDRRIVHHSGRVHHSRVVDCDGVIWRK